MSNTTLLLTMFVQITTILLACRAVGWLGGRVGQTQAVCDMVTGIALGPSLLGVVAPSLHAWLFPQLLTLATANGAVTIAHPSMSILYVLSQLGLTLFMFLVGLEFDTDLFRGRIRAVGAVSITGIVVPFALGAAVALALVSEPGFYAPQIGKWSAAFFTGACMSITAFPVLARILQEKGISSTRLGTMALAAGSLDDVVAWCLLAVLLAILHAQPATAVLTIAGALAFGQFMVFVGRRLLQPLARWTERDGGVTATTLVVTLLVVMVSGTVTERLGIHSVFGAFVAGIVMPRGRFAAETRSRIEPLTTTLLLPLFFVYSGLNTRIALVNSGRLWSLTALIIVIAVAGKGVACALAARASGEGWRESSAIGTLMNARGLIELIMLNIGLQMGVIQPTLFTILVLMAAATTLMASPLFHWFYGRHVGVRAIPAEPAALARQQHPMTQ